MTSKSKKTLVTGGAGFIGSHLVDKLLADGHHVTVVDNLANGRLDNLAHLGHPPELHVAVADITGSDSMALFFEGIDWVFHLAALADIVPSIERPLDYHRANVNGTMAVLEAARAASVQRFVYAASSSCYGLPTEYPTPETARVSPQYPYALTKYLGEQCVLHWHQVYALPAVSLRLFNVYGPRSRTTGAYGAVFGVFLKQKLEGAPFTVVGDGAQTRDFVFVTDVAAALVRAAESSLAGEIFNVGGGGTHSIASLVEILGGEAIHLPKRPGEPDSTYADITKIKELLHWIPKVTFEQGVGIMLDNIERWREAPLWTETTITAATQKWFEHLTPQANA